MTENNNIKEFEGGFGKVIVNYDTHTAIKPTVDFKKMPTSDNLYSSVRDVFYDDRVRDALLYYPFLLSPLSVEINKKAEQTLKDEKANNSALPEYEAGLNITMRACRLQNRDGPYKEPTILNLFEMYKSHLTDSRWIAYVGETILNLADAVVYLHKQEIVHLDITGKNVLVDAEPLEGTVEELFEKTRVYLTDVGGKYATDFCTARRLEGKNDPSMTGQLNYNYNDPGTRATGTAMRYGLCGTSALSPEQINHSEVFSLGALAATLLTGNSVERRESGAQYFDERQYIVKNKTLAKASSLIDVVRTTGLSFEEKDTYIPYASVDIFIIDFKKALQQHFYVLPRADLPSKTQQRLGTGKTGYVVCTPERFVQLMYGGNRKISKDELCSLIAVFTNPYCGSSIGNIISPTTPLVDVTEPVVPISLVQEILAFQKKVKKEKIEEKVRQSQHVKTQIGQLTSNKNTLTTEYAALNKEMSDIEKMEGELLKKD